MKTATNVVSAYRKAAQKIYGLTHQEARQVIYTPKDDRGEWAPGALGIVSFEDGLLPDYWSPDFLDSCVRLDREGGMGTFIEPVNAAVAAIWE